MVFRQQFISSDTPINTVPILRRTNRGNVDVGRLPYGIYRLRIDQQGFAPFTEAIPIRSSIALTQSISLKMATVAQKLRFRQRTLSFDPLGPGNVDFSTCQVRGRTMRWHNGRPQRSPNPNPEEGAPAPTKAEYFCADQTVTLTFRLQRHGRPYVPSGDEVPLSRRATRLEHGYGTHV